MVAQLDVVTASIQCKRLHIIVSHARAEGRLTRRQVWEQTWLDLCDRPSCWIALSALHGSSMVRCILRLWFATRLHRGHSLVFSAHAVQPDHTVESPCKALQQHTQMAELELRAATHV